MITFFSYETMWIAVVVFLALLALCFFAYCKYEHWLAKKLNPYVVSYQSDHNLENLKQGLDRWRPWAFSKHSKNIITANWFSALLDQQRWTEAEENFGAVFASSKNTQDKIGYHLLRGDYARAIGNTKLEEQERLISEQLKTKLGNKKGESRVLASAKESKYAFFCWLSFSVGLALFRNHQQYLHLGLNPWIVWSRSFYFGLVLVPSLLDLADSLVDPAQKGGC